jgi:hypothetical protein
MSADRLIFGESAERARLWRVGQSQTPRLGKNSLTLFQNTPHKLTTLGLGNEASLRSSSHGAGRAMSRAQARSKLTVSALRQQLRGVWYDARLERQLLEEAPAAYKDVESVMRAQGELTRVIRRLRPVLVHKSA